MGATASYKWFMRASPEDHCLSSFFMEITVCKVLWKICYPSISYRSLNTSALSLSPPPIAFSPSPPQPQLSRVTPRCSQWLQPTEISPCSSFTTLLNSTLMRILHYTVLIALYIKHKTCSLHTAVKLEATTHVTEGVIHTTDISKITLQTLTGFSACFLQTQLFISMSLHHYY